MTQLITAAEADALLVPASVYPEWHDVALEDEVKDYHIQRASNYMVANWSCPDTDWEDPATLTPEIQLAVAQYANADLLGFLYPVSDATSGGTGKVTELTLQAGSVKKTTKWDTSGDAASAHKAYLSPINELLAGQTCTSTRYSSTVPLTRV